MEQFINNSKIDNLKEGFHVISHNWEYLYVNEVVAKHAKMSKCELIGFKVLEKFPEIKDTLFHKKLKECLLYSKSDHFETEFKFLDGRTRWYDIRIKPIPEGICLLMHDITNRKKVFPEIFKPSLIFEEKLNSRTIELVSKNKNYMDSLRYAKNIQQTFLQHKSEIQSLLPNSLLIFKPKDILSGDFYWCKEIDNKIILIVADCTGHGVPGALMSMIGLENIKTLMSLSNNCSEMLQKLNTKIKLSLSQPELDEFCHDGMDLAICTIDLEKRTVEFTGANRPFWLVRNLDIEVIDIKGTRHGIGGYTRDDQHFETHEIQLEKGDTFYLFSDGYADSFGGPEGKKLKTINFKHMLLEINDKTMQQQEVFLDNFIENWKGDFDQVDDILVMGVRM